MALTTGLIEVLLDLVRIVASGTGQITAAFQKTLGGAQSIDRRCNFKLVFVASALCMVEVKDVICQWLTRVVGKDSPLHPDECIRQRKAGRLQMALSADFHLPVGR